MDNQDLAYVCPKWYNSHNHSQNIVINSYKDKHEEDCNKMFPDIDFDLLIPCEICSCGIQLDRYERHMDQHHVLMRQNEEEKALNGGIPCDICQIEIPFKDYEEHIRSHGSAEKPKFIIPPNISPVPKPEACINPSIQPAQTDINLIPMKVQKSSSSPELRMPVEKAKDPGIKSTIEEKKNPSTEVQTGIFYT